MAATITTIYPINGNFRFQAIITVVGDAAGDVSLATVIDPANLAGTPTKFSIEKIDSQVNNFACNLYWDASTPILAASVSQYDGLMDFKADGQARHNNAGTGVTGKLKLTTSGLSTGGAATIVINGYHR